MHFCECLAFIRVTLGTSGLWQIKLSNTFPPKHNEFKQKPSHLHQASSLLQGCFAWSWLPLHGNTTPEGNYFNYPADLKTVQSGLLFHFWTCGCNLTFFFYTDQSRFCSENRELVTAVRSTALHEGRTDIDTEDHFNCIQIKPITMVNDIGAKVPQ